MSTEPSTAHTGPHLGVSITEAMTGKADPLGQTRCGSCANAFEVERRADGRCGHCGGWFEVMYYVAQNGGPVGPAYAVISSDVSGPPVELYPVDLEGIINATSRAAWLSVPRAPDYGPSVPHEVHRPNGSMIARFEGGRRVDL